MLGHVEKETLLESNELDELKLNAYKSSKVYNERTQLWHDKHILTRHI